jgi:hypothetical protein
MGATSNASGSESRPCANARVSHRPGDAGPLVDIPRISGQIWIIDQPADVALEVPEINHVEADQRGEQPDIEISAGDFRRFRSRSGQFRSLETGPRISKSPPLAGLSASIRDVLSVAGWLAREDSKLRMLESKSTALRLSDAP